MEFLRDLWGFLSQRKKFWLLPVIVALVGVRRADRAHQRVGDRTVHLHTVLVARQAILGISAFYHDSAAALLVDGQIVAAAQEERFSRKRHDASFPIHACRYVLDEAGVGTTTLAGVAFYDKPFLKFERLLETYHGFAPAGLASFVTAMPAWIKEKLFMRRLLARASRRARARRATASSIPSTTCRTRRARSIRRRSTRPPSSPSTASASGRPPPSAAAAGATSRS